MENGKPLVLVLDDDANIVRMLVRKISKRFNAIGFHGKGTCYKEALDFLESSGEDRPSFAILDLLVNDRGGYELWEQMQSSGLSIPVIFLTGCREDTEEVIKARKTKLPIIYKGSLDLPGVIDLISKTLENVSVSSSSTT